MGLRDKIFGEPLKQMSAAMKTATTKEEQAEIFKSGILDINSRYNDVAGKGAVVIGTILGGVALSGLVKETNLSGLNNEPTAARNLQPVQVYEQSSSGINPMFIFAAIGALIFVLILRK